MLCAWVMYWVEFIVLKELQINPFISPSLATMKNWICLSNLLAVYFKCIDCNKELNFRWKLTKKEERNWNEDLFLCCFISWLVFGIVQCFFLIFGLVNLTSLEIRTMTTIVALVFDEIDSNANISIRGLTMWKQKILVSKCYPQWVLNPQTYDSKSNTLFSELIWHVLLRRPLNICSYTTWFLVRINRTWLYKDPKVSEVQGFKTH